MKKIFFAILILLNGLIISSCSQMINEPNEQESIQLFSLGSLDNLEAEQLGEGPKRDTSDRGRSTNAPTIFGSLLVKLKLTTDQRPLVESLLKEYNSCRSNCIAMQKKEEREILMSAKVKEDEIKKELKAGIITREQARERLSNLKKETVNLLKNLPIKEKIQDCMKSCENNFLNKLETILNTDQKFILKTWIEARSKRGNSGGRKDTVITNPRG